MTESAAKKRRFPRSLWFGLLLVLAAPVLFMLFFIRFPVTRDVPWATLLMFGLGIGLLAHAVIKAYREDAAYRGKVVAAIALVFGLVVGGFFSYATLIGARHL